MYAGDQAKALGLVDGTGYLDDAIELAKRQAGLTQEKVVTYRRPGEYRHNIYSKLMTGPAWPAWPPDLMTLFRATSPQFLYLWMP